ncbi:MAG: hypothetical protein ACRDMX_11245 [Solirubrobacteraceae bacterium]
MSLRAIVSYDDSQNDLDALMLGHMLREAGAALTLAYVRHATSRRHADERLSQRAAERLLARGASRLGDQSIERRVVVSASTGDGLGWLAARETADLIVFGSDYRTGRGHVAPGRSAQTLLEGGPTALALAPAGYADFARCEIASVGVLHGSADEAAIETAFALARALGGEVVDRDDEIDLLVVGSRVEAPAGRLLITAGARNAIERATVPVLVVARGVALRFESLVAV